MTYGKIRTALCVGMFSVAFVLTGVGVNESFAAGEGQPIEVSADTINYDAAQGIVDAQGSIVMKQNDAVLTGSSVHYNMKNLEGIVAGGVKAVKADAVLTADKVETHNNTRLVATGAPVLVKGESTLKGSLIDYDSAKQYASVPSDVTFTTPEGTLTTDHLEAFFAEDRAVGDGDVHLVSLTRQIDATSDHIVYYGLQGKGKAVLTGNARAVQEGNVIVGDTLTLNMDSQSADAQGRTKVIIIPKES